MKEYTYAEIPIGLKHSFKRTITAEDIRAFSSLTGDRNPLHLDPSYAKGTQFGRPVVFGLLMESLLSTLAGMWLPGKYSLILSTESFFKKPCFEGDAITVEGEVVQKIDAAKILALKTSITNQHSERIVEGKMRVQVLR